MNSIVPHIQTYGNGHSLDCEIIINGKKIGVMCPECVLANASSKVTFENLYSGCREDDDAFYRRFGVWDGKWKCSNGHSGFYRKIPGRFHKGVHIFSFGPGVLSPQPVILEEK